MCVAAPVFVRYRKVSLVGDAALFVADTSRQLSRRALGWKRKKSTIKTLPVHILFQLKADALSEAFEMIVGSPKYLARRCCQPVPDSSEASDVGRIAPMWVHAASACSGLGHLGHLCHDIGALLLGHSTEAAHRADVET